ncbi:hypothetical protein [Pseudonocardia sp. HH130630-07]|uniref:hypothetical protein n=1 Tax=Pseudonocardia sp. HH130630-07 TaxID=1690815 RepID=UPI00081519F2|nr:hypothetical protein [Pseudonocardia sp. HH130630-07]ANY07276.1 hypothetical protein AFB00_14405 [Pseudonocardia sp. HH130630-07]
MSTDPGQQGAPQYYRPGPSSGTYPQYPQNPYPQGWTPGTAPAPYPSHGPVQPSPAGLGPAPVRKVPRPRQVVSALILLLASVLPFVVMGVTALFVTVDDRLLDEAGVPRDQIDQAMAQTGMTMEVLNQLFRVMGGIFVVLALAYAVLAVVAFLGRSGARLTLAILTGVYGLTLLLLMAAMPLFAVLVIAVAASGVTLLYSAPAREWYAARRTGVAGRS